MAISHVPYWLDRVAAGRRPSFPRFKGESETGVVIVGGGLTGAACALAFASAGVRVVLLEAESLGRCATAGGLGLVREDPDARFTETVSAHGLAAARLMWQAFRRASLELSAVLRRADARCDLAAADLFNFSSADAESAGHLRSEYQARRKAGLTHSWSSPAAFARETALMSGGAIRTRGASLDPYRACTALASAAVRRGAVLYERSEVLRVRSGRKQAEVTTAGGSVRADAVLVATSAPLRDLKQLRRHLKPRVAYAVVTDPLPAAVRRSVGRRAAALRHDGAAPHFLRWLREDRVLFSGADQPEVPGRSREKSLVQRTGQLMYELSLLYPEISGLAPAWSWDVLDHETVDRLPFAGVHRNFPRHLFAIGGQRHGAGFSWLAARVLLRTFQGAATKEDDLFGFSRVL
jgi:gamma-glutamylputrescine oxidase